MHILPVTNENIADAVQVICAGGIVAHPTETCYGFACDLTNADAVQKLFALKKRPNDQPVSALFASVEVAKRYVEWNEQAEKLARKYLPGPLTLVLPPRVGESVKYHLSINGTNDIAATIGVRVSSHPVAQRLTGLCNVPLSTTSANVHGRPEPYSVAEIVEQFGAQLLQPDLILNGGVLPRTKPSTVVEVREHEVQVIRGGGVVLSRSSLSSASSPSSVSSIIEACTAPAAAPRIRMSSIPASLRTDALCGAGANARSAITVSRPLSVRNSALSSSSSAMGPGSRIVARSSSVVSGLPASSAL